MSRSIIGVKCPACNKGWIMLAGRPGRTVKIPLDLKRETIKSGVLHEVEFPHTLLLPTCSNLECRAEFIGREDAVKMDAVLATARAAIKKCGEQHRTYIRDRKSGVGDCCGHCGF